APAAAAEDEGERRRRGRDLPAVRLDAELIEDRDLARLGRDPDERRSDVRDREHRAVPRIEDRGVPHLPESVRRLEPREGRRALGEPAAHVPAALPACRRDRVEEAPREALGAPRAGVPGVDASVGAAEDELSARRRDERPADRVALLAEAEAAERPPRAR